MTDKREMEQKFWKAIESDRTVMLAAERVYPRPMTAQLKDGPGPMWFFTSSDSDLAKVTEKGETTRSMVTLASKNHELFATAMGSLSQDNDPVMIERLWNPFVAAWYPEGQNDPTLRLLRFDAENAEIWENESSLFAGIKAIFGVNPQVDYKDSAKKVKLRKGK